MDSTRIYSIPGFLFRAFGRLFRPYLIVLLPSLCLSIGYGLYARGFPDVTDFPFHVRWVYSYSEELKAGNVFPYWLDDYYNGFGGAVFILYGRTFHFLAAIANLVLSNPAVATLAVALLSLGAYGLGIYKLASTAASRRSAVLAALGAQIAPIVTYQISSRQGLPEILALATLTWSFYCLTKGLASQRGKRLLYAAAFAILYGLTITTHLITALIGTFFLIIILLFALKRSLRLSVLIVAFSCLGAGLAAHYLVPAIYQQQYLHTEAFIMTKHNFRNNFVMHNYANDDLKPPSFFRKTFSINLPPKFLFASFKPGVICFHSQTINFLLYSLFLILWLIKFHISRDQLLLKTLPFTFCLLLSLFMSSYFSLFIWERISFLQKIQFPWRWLSTATIPAFLCFADIPTWSVPSKQTLRKKIIPLLLNIIIFFVFALSLYYSYRVHTFGAFNISKPFSYYTSSDFLNSNFLPQEHLPRWVPSRLWKDYTEEDRKIRLVGPGDFSVVEWNRRIKTVQVRARGPAELTLPIFYYPNWIVHSADKKEKFGTHPDSLGRLTVSIPPGGYELVIRFNESVDMFLGNVLSLVSGLILFTIIIFRRRISAIASLSWNSQT